MRESNRRPLASAPERASNSTAASASRRLTSRRSATSTPASSFDRSSSAANNWSRDCTDWPMRTPTSLIFGPPSIEFNSAVSSDSACSGWRRSWLAAARNCDFGWLATVGFLRAPPHQPRVLEANAYRLLDHAAVVAHVRRQHRHEQRQQQGHQRAVGGVRQQPAERNLAEKRNREREICTRVRAARRERAGAPAAHHHREQRLILARQHVEKQQRRGAAGEAAGEREARNESRPALRRARECSDPQQPRDQRGARDQNAEGQRRPGEEQRSRRMLPIPDSRHTRR